MRLVRRLSLIAVMAALLPVCIASAQDEPPQSPPATAVAAPPDVAKPPADAKRTASGLAYKVLKAGTGKTHPRASSSVTVNYSGWTTDGQLFDTTAGRKAATFPLAGVIPGWSEGLQ